MNKLEQLHFDIITKKIWSNQDEKELTAKEVSQLTLDILLKFDEWKSLDVKNVLIKDFIETL